MRIHFIGIKGVGMAALAIFAKGLGHQITGSDIDDTFVTDDVLKKSKIPVLVFNPENITKDIELVIVSAAYDKNNPEFDAAKKEHLKIQYYSEALGEFTKDYQTIAVAGIHGKTTTAAILSFLLEKANLDPSFIIGAGHIAGLETIGRVGKGEYFVVEADEYRKSPENDMSKLFDLSPQIEIITSIELDHPDIFKAEEDVYDVFYKFACRIPRNGFIVLCSDYPKARKLERTLVDRNIQDYGFNSNATWQIVNTKDDEQETSFDILHNEKTYGPFKLALPGQANILNACAAIITCLRLGITERVIKKYLSEFTGVKRRFEKIGIFENNIIIDDYAHHPHALKMLFEAISDKYPKYKKVCIFQPHTYSRTKELLNSFATAFEKVDKVIITKIYSSAREKEQTISGAELVEAIRKFHRNVLYIEDQEKIIDEIENLEGKNIILTVGAGDVYKIGQRLLEKITNNNAIQENI